MRPTARIRKEILTAASQKIVSGGEVDVSELAQRLYPDLELDYAKRKTRDIFNQVRRFMRRRGGIVTISKDNIVKRAIDTTEYRYSVNLVRKRGAGAIDDLKDIVEISIREHPELLAEFTGRILELSNRATAHLLSLTGGRKEKDENKADTN